MAKHVARRATLLGWFDEPDGQSLSHGWSSTCVAVKTPENGYVFFPPDVNPSLADAISRLNDVAALSMSSEVTASVIDSITPQQKSLIVENTGARIPIVSSLDDVEASLTHSSRACVVTQERIVLVWSHDAGAILNVVHDVEKQLLGLVSRVAVAWQPFLLT
jgi:hypothetical protein